MPREPRTLDEEIIAAQEAAVRSTLSDEDRIERITQELRMGFDALAGVGAAASFFGSARTQPDDPDYELARETARIVARDQMSLSLVCDHRILYGADGAGFLARVRELLEQPLALAL